jgi:cysteine desulfuration protein SufE
MADPGKKRRRHKRSFTRSVFTPVSAGVDLGLAFDPPGNLNGDVSYPEKLQKIIDLFEVLPEEEKRETLIAYADQAAAQAPREGETFQLEDVRKDEECTDTVGVFLGVDDDRNVRFRITLGPQVQTLTRAMTAILCKGFEGARIDEVMDVPADFVPKIVGAQLVRQRSQTVYYILTRMKSACKVWLNRERAQAAAR